MNLDFDFWKGIMIIQRKLPLLGSSLVTGALIVSVALPPVRKQFANCFQTLLLPSELFPILRRPARILGKLRISIPADVHSFRRILFYLELGSDPIRHFRVER